MHLEPETSFPCPRCFDDDDGQVRNVTKLADGKMIRHNKLQTNKLLSTQILGSWTVLPSASPRCRQNNEWPSHTSTTMSLKGRHYTHHRPTNIRMGLETRRVSSLRPQVCHLTSFVTFFIILMIWYG